ncbi:MAG: SMI1/KNR4 family protein [Pseudomonadota bacterium]
MTVLERVMTNPSFRCDGPTTEAELVSLEDEWGFQLPAELRTLYLRFGAGDGNAGYGENAHFMIIETPFGITGWERDDFPDDMIPFGSNGGPDHLVYSKSLGYGLSPQIGHTVDDFIFVSATLEGFMQAAEDGTWFEP